VSAHQRMHDQAFIYGSDHGIQAHVSGLQAGIERPGTGHIFHFRSEAVPGGLEAQLMSVVQIGGDGHENTVFQQIEFLSGSAFIVECCGACQFRVPGLLPNSEFIAEDPLPHSVTERRDAVVDIDG